MIDRRVPCSFGDSYDPSDYNFEPQPQPSAEDIRRKIREEALQADLFDRMQFDATRFAAIMLGNHATPLRIVTSQDMPKRFAFMGTRSKDVPEDYWVVRTPKQTNYGGFPLFFPFGGDIRSDAFQRIIINTTGELRMHTSFGEEAPDRGEVKPSSKLATPSDVIYAPFLGSERDEAVLYGQWIIELATIIHDKTGVAPDMQYAQKRGLPLQIPGQREVI